MFIKDRSILIGIHNTNKKKRHKLRTKRESVKKHKT